MIDILLNSAVCLFGFTSIWLLSSKKDRVKAGCIAGLASEPFWLLLAVRSENWGIAILALAYTGCFIRGLIINRRAKIR